MSPNMLKKLERNISYHAAMAEYYDEEVKKSKEHPKEGTAAPANSRSTKPTASASPPKPDQNQVLADLHAGVVKQLMPVLLAGSKPPTAVPPPIRRDEMPELKPSAGRFH